jgi:hypothetical protein
VFAGECSSAYSPFFDWPSDRSLVQTTSFFALDPTEPRSGSFEAPQSERHVITLVHYNNALPNNADAGKCGQKVMGETFVKLAAHYTMSLLEPHLAALFPRIQFGVKRPGGSETAAQLTRAYLAQSALLHADTIALKTDFVNAFNSANRSQAWKALLADKRTEPIWRIRQICDGGSIRWLHEEREYECSKWVALSHSFARGQLSDESVVVVNFMNACALILFRRPSYNVLKS